MAVCGGAYLLVVIVAVCIHQKGRILAIQEGQESQVLDCEGGGQLLSCNTTLAPPELVQASSSLPYMPPSEVYNTLSTWCANDSDFNPYIDMQFTSPVLLTTIITSGTILVNQDELEIYYVTNFTLEYSPPENTSLLNFYSVSGERMYFEASDFSTLFQLERPFLTQRIRLRPVAWHNSHSSDMEQYDIVCLGVALYGCPHSQVQVISSPPPAATRDRSLDVVLPIMFITIAALTVVIAVLSFLLIKAQLNRSRQHGKPDDGGGFSQFDRSIQPMISQSTMEQSVYMENSDPTATNRSEHSMKVADNPTYGRQTSHSKLDVPEQPSNSRISELLYESMDSDEPPSPPKSPRVLLQRSEQETDRDKEVFKSGYEPVDIDKQNGVKRLVLVSDSSTPRPDSILDMTSNMSYGHESFGGSQLSLSAPALELDEQSDYEEIAAPDSNYDYVSAAPLPGESSQDNQLPQDTKQEKDLYDN